LVHLEIDLKPPTRESESCGGVTRESTKRFGRAGIALHAIDRKLEIQNPGRTHCQVRALRRQW